MPDGTRVEALKETTLHDDGRISTQTIPIHRSRSSDYSTTTQRGSPNEQGLLERQAVTRAAQLAVEEERLREKLEALSKLRDSTQAKRDDSQKQLDDLADPAREAQLHELQMECQRHATTQFDENNKATDLRLQAEQLRQEAAQTGAKHKAIRAKLAGEPHDEDQDIGGAASEEKAEELERTEKDLENEAAQLEAQAESAEASKQVAAEDWAANQAKIAEIEDQNHGSASLEAKIAVQTANLRELEAAHAALEAKADQAKNEAEAAKAEAMELLRAREKRQESARNSEGQQQRSAAEEAAAEEEKRQQREEKEKREAERQQAAEERRAAMKEREAELSRKQEEERQQMEREAAEYNSWLEEAHKDELWKWDRSSPQATRSWEHAAEEAPTEPNKRKPKSKPEPGPIGPKTEIGVWLRSMRMSQYEDQFKGAGFNTLDALIKAASWVTENDLREMGVVLAHRKSIIQCIRAVSNILTEQATSQPAPAAPPARTTPKAKPAPAPKLQPKQQAALEELFKAYGADGKLSLMGFGAMCVEAMACGLLTKEAHGVTAPHVRRWVRNGELGSLDNPVLERLFECVDQNHTGSLDIASTAAGLCKLWAGASTGWAYCKELTAGPAEELEHGATCQFIQSLSQFLYDLYANVAVLEQCHLEAVGVSGDRAQQRLFELRKELSTSEAAVSAQADVVLRILGRGRIGELPAPYRRLDELLKGLLSHDPKVDPPAGSAPPTPRGGQQTVRVGHKPAGAKKKPDTASQNTFNDTVDAMLESRLKQIASERASRKGARESNQRVPSPRRLTPLTVKVRRNNGIYEGRAVECSGMTLQHLIGDINKKLGFKFSKLYSLQGVEVLPSSITRPMELVASAGDPFVPIEQPAEPPKSILSQPAVRNPSPARSRAGASSPSRARLNPKPLNEESSTPRRRSPGKLRKAPLPPDARGPVTPRNAEAPAAAAAAAGGASEMAKPSPLATQVPRSSIRWASAARLQQGEWSDSRNIRRGAVSNF